MSGNTKDFKVKNGIQPTVYHEGLGTVTSGSEGYYLAGASYDSVSFSVSSQIGDERGLRFSADGTKFYVLDGNTPQSVYQYGLSTAWDLSTASYSSKSFNISSQETQPTGVAFKSDGTKMYIIGYTGDDVNEYTLSTAWDVSTASYSQNYSVSSQTTLPTDIYFKPDGTSFYVSGSATSTVYQYDLTTAWDISTASYTSNSIAVSEREGLAFNSDGTAFYVVGNSTDTVYEYNLTTAWDISTASASGQSFSVNAQDTIPYGIDFKSDGTKMYVLGVIGTDVNQYSTSLTTNTLDLSTGSVFEITPTSDIQINLSNPADSGTVSQATLLLDRSVEASGDLLFFAADAGNSSNYDDATGWTTIIDLGNQTTPDTNFYLVRQTAASDGSYDISFATNNSNALPSGGAFMCTNGATYQGVSNGTGTVSFASGLTVGESVLFLVESGSDSNTTYTPPAGYTVLFESTGTETTLTHTVVSYKIADATSESTSGGTFSGGSAYRALVHVRNAGTDAASTDMASQVQKATAVVSTFTVSDGQVSYPDATITYDSTLEFAGGTAPTSPAIGETDVITISTRDGGTTYQAVQAIDGAK